VEVFTGEERGSWLESGIRVEDNKEIGLYITNYYYQLWLYPGI